MDIMKDPAEDEAHQSRLGSGGYGSSRMENPKGSGKKKAAGRTNHLLTLAETTVSGTRFKKQGTSLHLFNCLHYFASLSSLKVQLASLIRFAGPIPGQLGSSLQKLSPGAGRVWPLDSMMHMTYIPSIGDSRLRRSLKSQNVPTF